MNILKSLYLISLILNFNTFSFMSNNEHLVKNIAVAEVVTTATNTLSHISPLKIKKTVYNYDKFNDSSIRKPFIMWSELENFTLWCCIEANSGFILYYSDKKDVANYLNLTIENNLSGDMINKIWYKFEFFITYGFINNTLWFTWNLNVRINKYSTKNFEKILCKFGGCRYIRYIVVYTYGPLKCRNKKPIYKCCINSLNDNDVGDNDNTTKYNNNNNNNNSIDSSCISSSSSSNSNSNSNDKIIINYILYLYIYICIHKYILYKN